MLTRRNLLLSVSLVLGLSLPAYAAELLDRIVAVANEDVVTANELAERVSSIRQQYRDNPQVLPPDGELRKQVLDALIIERLQLQLAQQMNLSITDSQVNDAVGRLARRQNMTIEQFVTAVQNSGQSYRAVREQIRRELTINQVRRQFVGRRVSVSEGEVERYLKTLAGQSLQEAEFELVYRRFSVDEQQAAESLRAELAAGASLADDPDARNLGSRKVKDLPSVFRTVVPVLELNEAVLIEQGDALHLAQLVDKKQRKAVQVTQYKVRHILVKPNAVLTEHQAQTLLGDLRSEIQQGASMAELADRFTDDIGSKGEGGLLGWRQADEFVTPFASQVRGTSEGEVSPVFESNFGYHILRVEGSRTEDVSLDVLRNQVRETLAQRKFEEALQRWLVELRAQSFVEIRL